MRLYNILLALCQKFTRTESVLKIFYDANTDRAVEANRMSAITHVVTTMLDSTQEFAHFSVRYTGGYYYQYICLRGYNMAVTGGVVVEVMTSGGFTLNIWSYNSAGSDWILVRTI